MLADRVHALALRVFSRLPPRLRLAAVHAGTVSYTVGALAVIRRDDGRILLVRQSYRRRWGLPGGLVARGEAPRDAVVREVREETGLAIEPLGEGRPVVEPQARRVDVVFPARPAAGTDPDRAQPSSAEITACRWFATDDLPLVQAETVGALLVLARSGELAGVGAEVLPAP